MKEKGNLSYLIPLTLAQRRFFSSLPSNYLKEGLYSRIPIFCKISRGDEFDYSLLENDDKGRFIGTINLRDHFGKIDLQERSYHDFLRRLYGVISIGEEGESNVSGHMRRFYNYFEIPDENKAAIRDAVEGGGGFRKELLEEDEFLLRKVYEENRRLRSLHPGCWNPRFEQTRLSSLSGMSEEEVVGRMERLTGLLAKTWVVRHRIRYFDTDSPFPREPIKEAKYLFPKWFVPSARRGDIERVLGCSD